MTWKAFWGNPEELFVGAMLQWVLIFVVGWWVVPIMLVTALLWRWGGVTGGWRPARWALVPLTIALTTWHWPVLIAAPFMVWLNPCSYGKESWLYKWLKRDLPVRLLGFAWYWVFLGIALSVR
jgi:hypothetical protein